MTYRTVVSRALAAGLAVGVLFAGYLLVVVEPVIDDAIALEEQLAAADHAGHDHDHGGDDALFTRGEQVGGGALASILYSVIMAGVFGTVYAATRHRLPGRRDFTRVGWLAAMAFGALALLPGLKYPATPPAVGDPDTVGDRTVQYLALVALGLLLAFVLVRLSSVLRSRLDDPSRWVAVTVAGVVGVAVLLVALPGTPDAIAPEIPAGLVWDFRIRSLGGLALVWTGLALGLGWLLERAAGVEQHDRGVHAGTHA